MVGDKQEPHVVHTPGGRLIGVCRLRRGTCSREMVAKGQNMAFLRFGRGVYRLYTPRTVNFPLYGPTLNLNFPPPPIRVGILHACPLPGS
jgi:hypothetical protein